jgi:ABC-type transporter Mla subunit MlaD
MFTSLGLPEGTDLRTKEDFKALIDAFERATQQLGEDKLRLTSTASAIKQGVAGQYDAATNTIRVPEYFAKDESVLAHEIVHAQTSNAVANPTKEQKPAVERLNKLYKHVKEVVEQRAATDKNFRSPYGITSLQEFIAEGLANPDFQYLLSRIRY